MQRSEYGSCTLPHQRCDSMIAEPSSSRACSPRPRLAGVRARAWICGWNARAALQRLERHRARDIGGAREPPRADEPSAPNAAMYCVPLISDRPSFAASSERLEADARERVGARRAARRRQRLALADQRQREVRERREIARRADRAARRHDAAHPAVQHSSSSSTVSTRAPEFPSRACSRAGASPRARSRRDTGRRRRTRGAQQPQLQLLGQLLGDRASTRSGRSRC